MSKPFFGGVPTDTEVQKLVEAYRDAAIDTVLPHEELEKLAGAKRRTSRYRTIITAWRKRMLNEHNVDIGSVWNTGYKVLDPAGRVSAALGNFARGTKQIGVARNRIVRTPIDKLPEPEQRAAEHKTLLITHADTYMQEQQRRLKITFDVPSPAEVNRPAAGDAS